jgi:hypothetical protein
LLHAPKILTFPRLLKTIALAYNVKKLLEDIFIYNIFGKVYENWAVRSVDRATELVEPMRIACEEIDKLQFLSYRLIAIPDVGIGFIFKKAHN